MAWFFTSKGAVKHVETRHALVESCTSQFTDQHEWHQALVRPNDSKLTTAPILETQNIRQKNDKQFFHGIMEIYIYI